jgi:hypothetical protein
MARTFAAAPAKREQVPLLIGIVSPSGGGKTFSALRLATGVQRAVPGEIVLIDTENRRALHYADEFKFTHIPFKPPFNPLDYLEVIRFAAARKPAVIIVDSMTHEHTGEGGYLETAEKIITRMAGDDDSKRERVKMIGWAKVGPQRTQMIEGIKQIGGNFIFLWRGKEKTKPIKNTAGRLEMAQMGLMAIGGEEWIYEMTVNMLLQPRANGVPDWSGTDPGERLHMKLPRQFIDILKPGTQLTENIGEAMVKWAIGGPAKSLTAEAQAPAAPATLKPRAQEKVGADSPAPKPPEAPDDFVRAQRIWDELTAAANIGYPEFAAAWNVRAAEWKDKPEIRNRIVPNKQRFIDLAKKASAPPQPPPLPSPPPQDEIVDAETGEVLS